MDKTEEWYVIKLTNGQCGVVAASQLQASPLDKQVDPTAERWGPFDSQSEAIARRVGLIRAGKCNPV